jgi:uncharacterized protein
MSLDEPLSDAELDELDDFLNWDAGPECDMNVSMLHGFLTAQAVGPVLVPPSELLANVWGEEGPLFDSEQEAERVFGLIVRLSNSINQELAKNPEEFLPILREEELEDGKTRLLGEEWCVGFSRGVGLRSREWERLLLDDKHVNLLAPIFAFTSAEAMAEILEQPGIKATREMLLGFIPLTVAAIYDYWKPERASQPDEIPLESLPVSRGVKVGRNAPCPCGSGKKYKKCCGARLD